MYLIFTFEYYNLFRLSFIIFLYDFINMNFIININIISLKNEFS